ncbi:MAG: DUF1501 domain-containing protein [Gammaproteobacteria bacterium]|nr:DUF1501 domain-containing protein [Gammaproteobacteria bacterium]
MHGAWICGCNKSVPWRRLGRPSGGQLWLHVPCEVVGIDHLWDQTEQQGLQDKVTVVVGSDFGRTPFYNSARGKDHWNVTSMMAMGAGVRGNRVAGATDAHVDALAVNSAFRGML